MKTTKIKIEFKLEDCWIGIHWKWNKEPSNISKSELDIWICLIPCFPLHIFIPVYANRLRKITQQNGRNYLKTYIGKCESCVYYFKKHYQKPCKKCNDIKLFGNYKQKKKKLVKIIHESEDLLKRDAS